MEYTNTFVKEYVKDMLDLNIDEFDSFSDLDKKKVKYINDTYIENDKIYQAYLKSKQGTIRIFDSIYNFVNKSEEDPIVFYTVLKSMFTITIFFILLTIITIFVIPVLFYVLLNFTVFYTWKIYGCIFLIILIYFLMIRGMMI